MPFKSPVSLRFTSLSWVYWVLFSWVFFVFFLFFFKLYSGWAGVSGIIHTFPLFPQVPFGHRWAVWKDSFLALTSGFLVMGILWSSGKRLFLLLSLEGEGMTRFCLEVGLGLFLFNCFWMGFGLTGLWVEPLWLVVFVLLVFRLLGDLLVLNRKRFSISLPGGWNGGLWILATFYGLFLLFHSLLPETFYDSLNYFLGMPSFWLWHHGICDYPTHLLSGYFHGGSLFFLNGFVLAQTEGAKVLAVLILLGTALFGYGWAKELAGPKAGAIAATAILTFPLLYLNSLAVRVDGLLAFVLLLFFYSLEKGVSLKRGGKGWLAAAGLFMGLALTIKPTAIVALGAAMLALFWRDGFKLLERKGWWIFAGIQILEVGPWLVKNACFAGNPFFPYALSLMGGRQIPPWSYERLLHENQQFLPMDQGILSIPSLPWRFTMPGAGDDQFIGPVLLAFLPVWFLLKFDHPTLKFLGRTLFLSLAAGLTLSHMLRFSIPAFVLAFLLLSVSLPSLKGIKWRSLWVGAVTVCALLCWGQYLRLSATWFDGGGVWTGSETRAEYLARKWGSSEVKMARWIDGHLPPDARLLMVGDARVLYYPRPFLANSVFDGQFFPEAARTGGGPEGIQRRLREAGVGYVLIQKNLGAVHSEEYHQYELDKRQWGMINAFVERGLEPLVSDSNLALYRVREALIRAPRPFANPFLLFPPQALGFLRDFSQKNYSRAGRELNDLLDFFPGDPFWTGKQRELKMKASLK